MNVFMMHMNLRIHLLYRQVFEQPASADTLIGLPTELKITVATLEYVLLCQLTMTSLVA